MGVVSLTMGNSSFASASSTLVLFSIASNPFPQFAPPPPNVLQPFPFVVQLVYNLSYLSDSFKIIVSKNPLKNASHIKNPLKPMKNTTKISPGVLSMPGDIVTHALFNFRRLSDISPYRNRSSSASTFFRCFTCGARCSCPWDMTSSTWRSARRSASGSAAVTMRSAAFPGSSVPVS